MAMATARTPPTLGSSKVATKVANPSGKLWRPIAKAVLSDMRIKCLSFFFVSCCSAIMASSSATFSSSFVSAAASTSCTGCCWFVWLWRWATSGSTWPLPNPVLWSSLSISFSCCCGCSLVLVVVVVLGCWCCLWCCSSISRAMNWTFSKVSTGFSSWHGQAMCSDVSSSSSTTLPLLLVARLSWSWSWSWWWWPPRILVTSVLRIWILHVKEKGRNKRESVGGNVSINWFNVPSKYPNTDRYSIVYVQA